MKTLREIMRPGFIFGVQRDASVADAARTMTINNVGIVAVFAGDRLVGVLSERDIVHRVVDRGLDPGATPVAEVMTTDLVVAQADDDYRSAMRAMDQSNIRHLPVVSVCLAIWLRMDPDALQVATFFGVSAMAIPLTILVAEFLYRGIERPGIALGSRLARRRKFVATAA